MERLNIPLRRTVKTTRRTRRVVWILWLTLVGAFGIGLFLFTSAWFQRNTLAAAKPAETQMSVYLDVNTHTWPVIETHTKNIPLITDRGLTLRHLAPYIHGKAALFIQADGTRSVAVHSTREALPWSLLDASGVRVQEIDERTFLLSSRLVALSTDNSGSKWRFPWLIPGNTHHIGRIVMETSDLEGRIVADKTTVRLYFPKQPLSTLPDLPLPDHVFAGLSTPSLTNTFFSQSLMQNNVLFGSFQNLANVQTFLAHATQSDGLLLVSNKADRMGFLLAGQTQAEHELDIETFLRLVTALSKPRIEESLLPDNTSSQEMRIFPEEVEITKRVISGVPVIGSAWNGQLMYFVLKQDKNLVISNELALVQFWLDAQHVREGKHAVFLKPMELIEIASQNSTHRTPAFARSFFSNLGQISLSNGWFFTKLDLY